MGVSWQKPRHHFKPFLAQIALLGSRQTGDYRWLLGKYYQRLKKYLDYWFWFCDYDKNGLCVWDGSDHSGMDNQARRCGYDGVMTVEGVDLNSYLVRELQAMGEIAAETGRLDEAESFRNQAEKLSRLINDVFWDEVDGFYYDRDERQNELVKIKSIAGLIPLWAGIAPEDRASRLVEEHILNPSEFWLPYPLATWARNEPDYYQERRGSECTWMGATWVPTNYMVFHGLLQYGYKDVARELADKTFRMVLQESATREYYNGETGSGQGLNPFWGWSTLAYLMPVEYQLGYDPTDLTRRDFLKIKKA
jgi:putative isomerase